MKVLHLMKSRLCLVAVLVVAVVSATGWFFTGYLSELAMRTIKKNVADANLIISLNLINELKRIEGAAVAVAGSPLTAPIFESRTPENIEKANNILDRYHRSLDAAACYLIDSSGLTLTSSNRRAKDSFVGQNYTFRSYFQQAVKGGVGRYFAFGTVSQKRGFFAAAPVKNKEGRIIGVVAIKKELDDIETKLNQYIWFLVDRNGIIFLSSLPEARLKSLWPLDNETNKQIVLSKQYGPGPFDPMLPKQITAGAEVTLKGTKYVTAQQGTPDDGISVILFWPTQDVNMYRSFGMALTLLSDLIVIGFFLMVYVSRQSIREREHAAQDMKAYADQLKAGAESKTQISRISTELQKSDSLEELAQTLMSHLAPLTGIFYGAFYVMDEQEGLLKPVGGYGWMEGKEATRCFAVGQGLVGQCAREKAPIDVTDSQINSIRITWGGGSIHPREILLLPVMQLERVLAVIELAALNPFTPEQRALLAQLTSVVALNIEILQRNIRTRELLEQSQAQSMALAASERQLLDRRDELENQKKWIAQAEEAAARAEQARNEAERAQEELKVRMLEIERFNRLSLGREERIIELKRQVNEIAVKADGKPIYQEQEMTAGTDDDLIQADSPLHEPDQEEIPTQVMADMLGVDMFKRLLEDFCDSVGIASAIIDLKGTVLAAARWQRACTDFHRANEKTCARCIESDTELAINLSEGKPFSVYRCKNGLTDAAAPIIVNGKHVANTFVGQFFTVPPDLAFFRRQAEECGLDKERYLEAIKEVPIVAENKLESILGFLVGVAQTVATMSMDRDLARKAEISIARRAEASKRERLAAMSLAEDANHTRTELERYKDRLELLVQERTEELRAARETAETHVKPET
jgi:C4-dicarboxylate-specific signal transduction histidine kinase